jgi:YidC/Oxa1 family membrane protein insertase
MFDTLIVQPIFNLLVLIYAILPGHNFGIAIILFTVVIRLLMWPLVKKQLHHAKAMRELQPELKRIKKEAKGDRQKESAMTMALYKEKEINPFGSIGLLIVQIPILIALYSGISRVIKDPQTLIDFAYPFVQKVGNLPELAANIHQFDATLFGFVDLTRAALNPSGGIYWPAMILVVGSAVTQYFQSKQLMPSDKDARKLRDILRDAGTGRSADQSEVNNAVGRSTKFIIPVFIFIFTVNLPSALSLYWLTSGIVAIIQQARVLGRDEKELEKSTDKPSKPTAKQRAQKAVEAEVITKAKKSAKKSTKKGAKKKKGRK